MIACDGTSAVAPRAKKHMVLLAGMFAIGGQMVLARASLQQTSEGGGVRMKVCFFNFFLCFLCFVEEKKVCSLSLLLVVVHRSVGKEASISDTFYVSFFSLSFSWVFVAQIGVRCEDEDVAELVMSCIA